MNRLIVTAWVIVSSVGVLGAHAVRDSHSPPVQALGSERFADFPPILLPESAAPALPADRSKPGQSAELVFAFVVDTLGHVEMTSVETLAAPDSAVARSARSNLSGVRYIPARIVLDVGQCVEFNGNKGHCGGTTPTVRKLRARVVLRINTSVPVS